MLRQAPVSKLESHLGYWLRAVSNGVSQAFARKVEAEGVTVAEWVVLRMLYDVDDLSPTLLAGRMGMTKGAISKLADRLADKGLLERRVNAEDRRAQTLVLNAKGRAIVPRLAALADENDAAFFGPMASRDREALERILRTIVERRGLLAAPVD
jgi:DNA-binding MarR family transcriptional regulator